MKQKTFYTVEVSYNSDTETRLFRIPNMDPAALKKFREDVFICGVYRKIDDSTGEIISPWNIRQLIVYRQQHFFSVTADLSRIENPKSNFSPKQ